MLELQVMLGLQSIKPNKQTITAQRPLREGKMEAKR